MQSGREPQLYEVGPPDPRTKQAAKAREDERRESSGKKTVFCRYATNHAGDTR